MLSALKDDPRADKSCIVPQAPGRGSIHDLEALSDAIDRIKPSIEQLRTFAQELWTRGMIDALLKKLDAELTFDLDFPRVPRVPDVEAMVDDLCRREGGAVGATTCDGVSRRPGTRHALIELGKEYVKKFKDSKAPTYTVEKSLEVVNAKLQRLFIAYNPIRETERMFSARVSAGADSIDESTRASKKAALDRMYRSPIVQKDQARIAAKYAEVRELEQSAGPGLLMRSNALAVFSPSLRRATEAPRVLNEKPIRVAIEELKSGAQLEAGQLNIAMTWAWSGNLAWINRLVWMKPEAVAELVAEDPSRAGLVCHLLRSMNDAEAMKAKLDVAMNGLSWVLTVAGGVSALPRVAAARVPAEAALKTGLTRAARATWKKVFVAGFDFVAKKYPRQFMQEAFDVKGGSAAKILVRVFFKKNPMTKRYRWSNPIETLVSKKTGKAFTMSGWASAAVYGEIMWGAIDRRVQKWDESILKNLSDKEKEFLAKNKNTVPGGEYIEELEQSGFLETAKAVELLRAHSAHFEEWLEAWKKDPKKSLPRVEELAALVGLSADEKKTLLELIHTAHGSRLEDLLNKSKNGISDEQKLEFNRSLPEELFRRVSSDPRLSRISEAQKVFLSTAFLPLIEIEGNGKQKITDLSLLSEAILHQKAEFQPTVALLEEGLSQGELLQMLLTQKRCPQVVDDAKTRWSLIKNQFPDDLSIETDRPPFPFASIPTDYKHVPGKEPLRLENEWDRWRLLYSDQRFKPLLLKYQSKELTGLQVLSNLEITFRNLSQVHELIEMQAASESGLSDVVVEQALSSLIPFRETDEMILSIVRENKVPDAQKKRIQREALNAWLDHYRAMAEGKNVDDAATWKRIVDAMYAHVKK